MPLIRR